MNKMGRGEYKMNEIADATDEYVSPKFPNADLMYFGFRSKRYKAAFMAGYEQCRKDMSGWRYPSKGDKPEIFEDVLIFCKNCKSSTYIIMGYLQNGFWYDVFNGKLDDDEEVIAWHYLPEPPE